MKKIEASAWKSDMPVFREIATEYYNGTLPKNQYKGKSGRFGSYAQKAPGKSMLRLRMTAGQMTKEKMAFVAAMLKEYDVDKLHFTTCQAVQLHNLDLNPVCEIMEKALDAGIVTVGGGGDFPRNTMCSPLSGVEKEEYFNVLPYAKAVGEFAMNFINLPKLPRKYKITFSNSPKNITHATIHDLGFVARPDGTFDVYSAGGMGPNPKVGVVVAEGVQPEKILYYVEAMRRTFLKYGIYDPRSKARTRYMQDTCGGPEGYKKAFLEVFDEVIAEGENLDIAPEDIAADLQPCTKAADGELNVADYNGFVYEQKQAGLYAVKWHPIGGCPVPAEFCAMNDLLQGMDDVEVRISPDESAYIINLTANEVKTVLAAMENMDVARTLFETSVACIGGTICQQGLRDSQGAVRECIEAVRAAGVAANALPRVRFSGCPSSCSAHHIGALAFRGAAIKGQPAFMVYAYGDDEQSKETFAKEMGAMLQSEIPNFLIKLGQTVEAAGLSFDEWYKDNAAAMEEIIKEYLPK